MTHDEYLEHDALGLAERVRARDVKPVELLEIAIERAERLNPRLNAIVYWMADAAEAALHVDAHAPFCGVPFLAKDLLTDYEGHPTSAGSRVLVDLTATHDSELARRVRAAGLLVFGKTNLPEWGLAPYTEPELWGPCRNPWDEARTPGGSSGGSAAAIAGGIVPMAGAGDGAGSIRIPASCCGLFGLKPTRSRTPTGPDRGLVWRGATVEHVLTRSVRDSAAMLDATHGAEPGAPFQIAPPARPWLEEVARDPAPLRIAWTTRPLLGSSVHADCVAAVEDALGLLRELGHRPEEATPDVNGPAFSRTFLEVVSSELAADLEEAGRARGRRPRRRESEPVSWALALLGRSLPASDYAAALRSLEHTGRVVGTFLDAYDVLLTPTLAAPPPPIGALSPTAVEDLLLRVLGFFGSGRLVRAAGLLDQLAGEAFELTPWTPLFNVGGQPAMSVPLHWNADGLPIGVQLVAPFGREDVLFRLAGQLERARPWLGRLPELARSIS